MSISWYEKKPHQEKPPNPMLEPTLNLDPHPCHYFSGFTDLHCANVVCSAAAADPRDLKTLALRMVTL